MRPSGRLLEYVSRTTNSSPSRADESRAEANQSIVETGAGERWAVCPRHLTRAPAGYFDARRTRAAEALRGTVGSAAPRRQETFWAHWPCGIAPLRRGRGAPARAASKTRRATSSSDGSSSADSRAPARAGQHDRREQPLRLQPVRHGPRLDQRQRAGRALRAANRGPTLRARRSRATAWPHELDDPTAQELVDVDLFDGS